MVSRAYSFKQLCEKSDAALRQYVNNINFNSLTVPNNESVAIQVKCTSIYSSADVIEQSSIFNDIFSDATTHSLVENFSSHGATAGM